MERSLGNLGESILMSTSDVVLDIMHLVKSDYLV